VDAILARLRRPDYDVLAETEAEISAREQAEGRTGLDLTDVPTLRALLRRHGLRPRKSFGQHLLVDRPTLEAIVAAAELQPDDCVLEVGAGTGVLTVELAQRARRVVAVELDQAILPVLRETTAPYANLEIIPRDLLDVQPEIVFGDAPYKLVANLPYYITALTLRHFLEAANPPRLLVVMVQLEVAQRLTAAPGDMSLLSLSVQFYGTPRLIQRVPAAAFYPPPQVDSAVVRVDLFPTPPLEGAARERFFALAHAGFAEKRKMLHNSLARNLRIPQETVGRWLSAAEIEPTRRAETLSVDDWLRLTRIVLAEEQG
jgi:16S rRNA (adenine1518-N6/adenine1519-N6)-dimethyltransferase